MSCTKQRQTTYNLCLCLSPTPEPLPSADGGLQQSGHCFSDAVAAARAVAVNDTVILSVHFHLTMQCLYALPCCKDSHCRHGLNIHNSLILLIGTPGQYALSVVKYTQSCLLGSLYPAPHHE